MSQPGPSRKRSAPSVEWDYPQRTNLMTFDNSDKEVFDVELVVEDQSFYVMKGFLARHSTTFRSLFFGDYKEKGKKRIELKDIAAYEFQLFLECINGCPCVDENSVELIAKLAERWNAPIALARCEEFLMTEPKEKMKKCFELAVQYKMDKLKTKLITDIKTTEELALIAPTEFDPTLDAKILFVFLQKAMSLLTGGSANQPPPTARVCDKAQCRQFIEQQYHHFTNFRAAVNLAYQQQVSIINQACDHWNRGFYAAAYNNVGAQQYQNPFVAAAADDVAAAPRHLPEEIEDDDEEEEDPVQPPTPQPILNNFQLNYQVPIIAQPLQLNQLADFIRAQGNNLLQQQQPYPQEYAQPVYLLHPPEQR